MVGLQVSTARSQAVNCSHSAAAEPPVYCTCPITHEIMADPVIAADGHTCAGPLLISALSIDLLLIRSCCRMQLSQSTLIYHT